LNYLLDNVILKKINCITPESLAEKLDSLTIGDSFVLKNVYFEFDKAVLKLESFPYLDKLAEYLDTNHKINILIIGHTDNVGPESYNKDLSLKRAKAIYDYLINNKIDGSRLDYKGVGSSQPLVMDNSEEGNSANRRVEIKITE
jgi:outer membrane protein OmpA-like peptidoglycan-associated protein